ncbi:MAG: SDR family oxidoreductase [Alphaproteobacteria bacterium]|nr:SDR family oxidoreductase [Alphaproteobacteria bacterium]
MLTADLTGERMLITGGASGIGRAASLLFSRCGAVVAVNHLAGDPRGEETVAEINAGGAQAVAVPGDVSDPKGADAMVAAAIDALGGLDILICNAGTPGANEPIPHDDLDAMTEEFWSKLLSTNLIGPFRCIRAARAALTESKGVVVSTASIAGLGGNASSVAYGASKAGLINVTRNLARALGPDIRVNAVAPGLTRTPWTEPWPAERKARSVENTMLKRMVEPEEIAQAMLYLAVNGAVTGQTVVVDCGRMF